MSRNRVLAARALVGLLLLVLCAGLVPANAAAATRPRVLLTGDSITQGFHGDYTWRYRLAKEFARQGRAVDLVGSYRSPNVRKGWSAALYADPGFDQDHYATASATISSLSRYIQAEVAKQQPDVVVLMAGVNDLRNGATPTFTDSRLRNWIREARAGKADVRLVIGMVLDARDPRYPDLSQRIRELNAKTRATVAELTTAQSPISWADTTNGWSVAAHTSEDLHPNPTGDTLIAQRMGEALARVGVLGAPSIYRTNTVWNRQPRVRVTIRNQRAVLNWDFQAIWGARVYVKRAGHRAWYPYTRYGYGTMTTSALVPRATYDFRVQLFRGRMYTPLGPVTRVTVPRAPRPAAVGKVVVDAAGVRWARSALATRYVVKLRKAGTRRWVTRRTATGLAVSAPRVVRAKVWAVNGSGRSAVRVGVR